MDSPGMILVIISTFEHASDHASPKMTRVTQLRIITYAHGAVSLVGLAMFVSPSSILGQQRIVACMQFSSWNMSV